MRLFLLQALSWWAFFSLTPQSHAIVQPKKSMHKKAQSIKDFPQQKVLRPELTKQSPLNASKFKKFSGLFNNSSITLDKLTGQMRVMSGDFSKFHGPLSDKSSTEDFVTAAMSFIIRNQSFFPSLTDSNIRLDRQSVFRDGDHQFIKFRVFRGNRRIDDAMIDFRFKFGKLVQVANNSYSEAPVRVTKTLPNIYDIVKEKLDPEHLTHKGSSYRVIANDNGYELIQVEKFISIEDGEKFDVQARSDNGEIFERTSVNLYISGNVSGSIYDRSWQEDRVEVPFSDLHVALDTGIMLTTDQAGMFENDQILKAQASVNGLNGPNVRVTAVSGDLVSYRSTNGFNGQLKIDIASEEDENKYKGKDIAQAMIFYHVNKMIAHAKKYIDVPWFAMQLPANANLHDTCNAHWSRLEGTINFYSAGNNCANTALVSDIIYHEWGHGFDQNTGGIEDRAFSEGIGDLMSLIMTRSNVLATGFKTDGGHIRNLDPDKVYPKDQSYSVHAEGLIIGSTIYDLFQELSADYNEDIAIDLISRYVFKVLPTASKYTDVYHAVLVIDDDDGNLNNGTPNLCTISRTFNKHGLADLHPNCYLGTKRSVVTKNTQGNRNGYMEPGESFEIKLGVHNDSSIDIAGMTATASIRGNDQVSLVNDQLKWLKIPVGQALLSENQIELAIGDEAVCGSEFTVVFDQKTATRSGSLDQTFRIGKHVGGDINFAVEGLPAEIPDKSSVEFEFENGDEVWQDDTTIMSARAKFNITHTYRGDLTVYLTPPEGDKIQIYKGSGADDNVNFDKDISDLLEGKKGKGKWILEVKDKLKNDTGTIDSFELTLNPYIFLCE